jgi:hypothetical protein
LLPGGEYGPHELDVRGRHMESISAGTGTAGAVQVLPSHDRTDDRGAAGQVLCSLRCSYSCRA